jgi:hypothetical protein
VNLVTTNPAPAPEAPPITEAEAAAIMTKLKINADPQALILHKQLGQFLIQHDVGATQLAKNFDSEAQIAFAVDVARELAQSPDPEIRVRGVQSLLLAIKTRTAVAEQAIKLAAASKGKTRSANRPPVFNGPVTVLTQSPPIPV